MSVPCPRIVTYESDNPPVHHMAWYATFYCTQRDDKRGIVMPEPLPMPFYAATEERVVERATKWWNDRQAEEANRLASIKRGLEKRGLTLAVKGERKKLRRK